MITTPVQDLGTVIRKELKEFFVSGGERGRYLIVFVLGIFGVVVPLITGSHDSSWVSTIIPAFMYGLLLPTVLVMGVGADTFAGERERHTLETLLASRLPDWAIFFGKLIAVTIFGWGQSLLAAVVALVVVNIAHRGALALYPGPIALSIIIFGLQVSLVAAATAALVSLRASTVRQAQQMLSLGLVVIVFGISFGVQALPSQIRQQLVTNANSNTLGLEIMVLLAAIAAVLVLWAMALFRRSRLILSAS